MSSQFQRVYLVKTFIRTLRETARVESVTNSPVLTHLGETIAGASTIRAFDKINHFKKNHFGLQDTNLLAMIFNKGMRSWFNVRINLISQLIILFSFTYCVSFKENSDPTVIAIMMVYLVQIQTSMSNFFSNGATVEVQMISFNRLVNMLEIPQEAEQRKPLPINAFGEQFISRGMIEFDHFTMKYRPDTDIVLNDICLKINHGEKVGVVGRTGAGKSTL